MLFSRRQVSQGERRRGVFVQRNIQFVSDILSDKRNSSTLQAMSRPSSVGGRRDIPARRRGERKFSSRQEGCQGLPEDRRGNQSSQGKLTKLVSNTKKPFSYTLFYEQLIFTFIFFPVPKRCQGYRRQIASGAYLLGRENIIDNFMLNDDDVFLSLHFFFLFATFVYSVLVPPRGLGVSILGGAIVASVRIRTNPDPDRLYVYYNFSPPPSFLRSSEAK